MGIAQQVIITKSPSFSSTRRGVIFILAIYCMLKTIKEWIKDYQAIQKELNLMGMFTVTTMLGSYVYWDKELYDRWLEKKEEDMKPPSS